MRIGLVGSGGREHALAKALTRNCERDSLIVFANSVNPGIQRLARRIVSGSLSDSKAIADALAAEGVELAVIGPESPLMAGAVDELRNRGVPTVGPTRLQARLESDKSFMRDLLKRRVGWGSPEWCLAHNRSEARDFICQVGEVAVKPLGLTGGKGVKVMGTQLADMTEAVDYAAEWIARDGVVLLEERLVGEEFSRMVFASDNGFVPMPVAQDFKYAFDGDSGSMTGGMGAYTMADGSLPFLNEEDLRQADQLIGAALRAITEETGTPYRGVLYGQFMVTAKGIRLIEFNTRFGDPEAINLMALLQSDAPVLFLEIATGSANSSSVEFARRASVVRYLVPQVYPEALTEPLFFSFDEKEAESSGLDVIFASVALAEGGRLQALGSRTLALVGLDDHPYRAAQRMDSFLVKHLPSGLRYRCDIGAAEIIQRKVERMQMLRAGAGK
jgi:phosphoribosylamine--glycine ligase